MKWLLFLSDLHVFSKFAIFPPNFKIPDYGEVPHGVNQKILWKYWLDMLERLKDLRFDYLILVGDLVEGRNNARDQLCTEVISPDPLIQGRAAIELLKPLAEKAEKKYVIRGSVYHDQVGGAATEYIGEMIGAERFEDGTYSTWWLILNPENTDVIIDVCHFTSVPLVYRGTPLEREGFFEALAANKFDHPTPHKPDLIVRGHVHYFEHIEHSTMHIITLPCWQLQTPYQIRRGRGRMIPDIGAVLVQVMEKDEEEKRSPLEQDPIRVYKILYKHPKIGVRR